MEIFFNEISIQPRCEDNYSARNKVLKMLETMKALREHDFNVLRTHNNFYAEDIGYGYTFSNFIADDTVRSDLRLLLRSIVKNPFIADENSYEAEVFIMNKFTTSSLDNMVVSPEGLAIAYLYNSPTISLTGHSLWEKETIPLLITKGENQSISEQIVNFYNVDSTNSNSFKNWILAITPEIQLNSEHNILRVFPPTKYEFDNRAIEDIISWYYDDKRFINRIKDLIEDISLNPFTGGKGHTETLAGSEGKASKRIIKKDRIVYTYSREKIIIHQCREHY